MTATATAFPHTTVYGVRIQRHEGAAGVVGEIDRSLAGNVILRAGHSLVGRPGWTQTEHIVMAPDEAREFAAAILAAVDAVNGEAVSA